jgi:hypothetical protein
MKHISLNFSARVRLSGMLGVATGSLARVTALQAVYNRVKFTDDEMACIAQEPIGDGKISYTPPDKAFGQLETDIENAEAEYLLGYLNQFEDYNTLADVPWVEPLKDQLRQPVQRAEPSHQFRRRKRT